MTEFNLSNTRETVKNILNNIYTKSNERRLIELCFSNVETQDKEFIKLYENILIQEDITSFHKQRLITKFKELAGEK